MRKHIANSLHSVGWSETTAEEQKLKEAKEQLRKAEAEAEKIKKAAMGRQVHNQYTSRQNQAE